MQNGASSVLQYGGPLLGEVSQSDWLPTLLRGLVVASILLFGIKGPRDGTEGQAS